jgi:hypothetical protein
VHLSTFVLRSSQFAAQIYSTQILECGLSSPRQGRGPEGGLTVLVWTACHAWAEKQNCKYSRCKKLWKRVLTSNA